MEIWHFPGFPQHGDALDTASFCNLRIKMAEQTLEIKNHEHIPILFGPQDQNLRQLRASIGIEIVLRGNELRIRGEEPAVTQGRQVVQKLLEFIRRHRQLPYSDFERILDHPEQSLDSTPAPSAPATPVNGATTEHAPAKVRGAIDLFEKSRKIVPRTPGQAAYTKAIEENDLVFCAGPAGCGKTYLAVAMALNALRRDLIRKIVLVRPAVEAGEKLGFLPGDMLAKVNPFLRPLLDALNDMLDHDQVQFYMDNDVVEIAPLAFMRGRTLNNTFIILDEAQNTTITQMKMFLTRMGTDSKIVVTGDTTQVDLPSDVPSGLTDAMGRLSHIDGIRVVQLTGQDIVRHRLVREIVRAYDWSEHS